MNHKFLHEVGNCGIVLPKVVEIYEVEFIDAGHIGADQRNRHRWGIKYNNTQVRYFFHMTREEAEIARNQFMLALESCLEHIYREKV